MTAALAAAATLGLAACAPHAVAPAPTTAAKPPHSPETPTPAAAAPAPALPTAGPVAERPSCLGAELRSEGRLIAAEQTPEHRLAFCVRRGFGAEAVTRCLEVDPETNTVRGHEELWPGFRLGDVAPPANPGGALVAGSAGTLTVCAAQGDCYVRRFRPPAKDAWDEVYGSLPAFTLPGSRRVLVADVVEGRGSGNQAPPATLWLHSYDIGKKARVGQARVASGEYGLRMSALGSRVLLVTCEREGPGCHGFVIDPRSLRSQSLEMELDPALRGGMSDPMPPSMRLGAGRWLVADARGTRLLLHDDEGRVTRRVTLAHPGDLRLGPSRVIPMSGDRVAVVQSAPNAGTVEWVSLADGTVTSLVPPDCPAPPNP